MLPIFRKVLLETSSALADVLTSRNEVDAIQLKSALESVLLDYSYMDVGPERTYHLILL